MGNYITIQVLVKSNFNLENPKLRNSIYDLKINVNHISEIEEFGDGYFRITMTNNNEYDTKTDIKQFKIY